MKDVGELDECGVRARTSTYKTNSEDVMYNIMTVVNITI